MIWSTKTESYRPVFAIGTGRCGTHLLDALMRTLKSVSSHHIQDLIADSFYRYCAWNSLPIDNSPFIYQRMQWIEEAASKNKLYFESNPYLSFHVKPFATQLSARFIFLIRNPEDVVKSHIYKGWYENDLIYGEMQKVIGFQYDMKPNHFFGRIVPTGEAFERWNGLTRVGKIAWMWNKVNLQINHQLMEVNKADYFFLKVEELTYKKFSELVDFMGFDKTVDEKKFMSIIESRPGKGKERVEATWGDKEWNEFYAETETGRKQFDY